LAQVFVGHDWAEDHHDIEFRDGEGRRLDKARLPEGVEGVARFHALVAEHVDDPAEVVAATETDRGLFVGSLVAAGYEVYAINPMSVARYRERHSTSGAKSDPGDAATLAELARTDRHHHRRIAGGSDWRRRSRCWPRPIRAWSGPGSVRSTSCAPLFASTTRPPST
jgi:hypothetical protein